MNPPGHLLVSLTSSVVEQVMALIGAGFVFLSGTCRTGEVRRLETGGWRLGVRNTNLDWCEDLPARGDGGQAQPGFSLS